MKSVVFSLLAVFFSFLAVAQEVNPPSIQSSRGAWPIRRQWTPDEVRHYAQWVENIFEKKTKGTVEQRTAKVPQILADPEVNLLNNPVFLGRGGNPELPASVIRAVNSMIDCGRFTAFLPAYYAYRRALPWMSAYVAPVSGDVRTSAYNIPSGYASSFESPSVTAFFGDAILGFSSGNYRVNLNGRNSIWSDTVPVAINREHLIPGCINYVDGHCLLLAKVTEYGELYFLNASTTVTRDIFTYNGMNTVGGLTARGTDPDNEWNGCYQGLRVPRYPIAITNARGEVIGVRRRTNDEMREFGFSTEQYDIVREITHKQYITEGDLRPQSFHDLIRLRMKTVDRICPLEFMESYADELLDAYRFREDFVQDAWRDVRQNGPIVYPEEQREDNIFQATGRWETWSSPSSDVDRRNKYFYLADWLEYAVRCYGLVPKFVDLKGLEKYHIQSQSDLADALVAEKNRIFASKSMAYTNSKGQKITLTLSDIEARLYDLSFDPNHPPELRWGAPAGSEERASAPTMYTPVPTGQRVPMEQAYAWQAYYRSLGQRETDMSCLRGMFTTGYPIRDKLDAQLGKWVKKVVETVAASVEPEIRRILVPAGTQ